MSKNLEEYNDFLERKTAAIESLKGCESLRWSKGSEAFYFKKDGVVSGELCWEPGSASTLDAASTKKDYYYISFGNPTKICQIYHRVSHSSTPNRISFEELLELLPNSERTDLLFHLDIFS